MLQVLSISLNVWLFDVFMSGLRLHIVVLLYEFHNT